MELPKKIPHHVAIIMDGNGRWAKKRSKPRLYGHKAGAQTVDRITREARRLGIQYLTLYAFSEQNWDRPKTEVSGLMGLLAQYLRSKRQILMENDIKLKAIGDIQKLPNNVLSLLYETIELTKHNDSMTLTLALSYGGQEDILAGVKKALKAIINNKLNVDSLDLETFHSCLPSSFLPPIDLMIRTSGEMRISNFLLWHLAYSELYFTKTPWPDFDEESLQQALREYSLRERRFGLTSEQLQDD